jgi:hypothetical protein
MYVYFLVQHNTCTNTFPTLTIQYREILPSSGDQRRGEGVASLLTVAVIQMFTVHVQYILNTSISIVFV